METPTAQDDVPLPWPVAWIAEGVDGWLMLENTDEAAKDLATIPPEFSQHPTVLALEWKTATAAGHPAQAWLAAHTLCRMRPNCPVPWLCQANALRELRGPQAAADVLLGVVDRFKSDPIVPYNLACFLAQVGDMERTCSWLMQAFEREEGNQLKDLALLDPDLQPLWETLGEDLPQNIHKGAA